MRDLLLFLGATLVLFVVIWYVTKPENKQKEVIIYRDSLIVKDSIIYRDIIRLRTKYDTIKKKVIEVRNDTVREFVVVTDSLIISMDSLLAVKDERIAIKDTMISEYKDSLTLSRLQAGKYKKQRNILAGVSAVLLLGIFVR